MKLAMQMAVSSCRASFPDMDWTSAAKYLESLDTAEKVHAYRFAYPEGNFSLGLRMAAGWLKSLRYSDLMECSPDRCCGWEHDSYGRCRATNWSCPRYVPVEVEPGIEEYEDVP